MSKSAAKPKHQTVLIGYGQIARAQHVPIILSRPEHFCLSAVVDPGIGDADKESLPAPGYNTLTDALANNVDALDTAIITCPPNYASDYAQEALQAGLNALMEKPPGLDHERLLELKSLAKERNITLFTGYHSTFCPQLMDAKEWIRANGPVQEVQITWKESAAKWHPDQHWITQYFGVLDILFNPLSMLEELLGSDMSIESSKLIVPRNWSSPIAGTCILQRGSCRIAADFAWNHEGNDIWKIAMMGGRGDDTMELHNGGAKLLVNGVDTTTETEHEDILRPEYEALYNHFYALMSRGESHVRPTPLRLLNEILEQSVTVVGEAYQI